MKQLDNCTLYCGDCINLLSKIKDKSVSVVITDPPYWHNKGHGLVYKAGSKTILKNDLYMAQNDMMGKFSTFTPKKIKEFLNGLIRVMKLMNGYFFCNDSQIATYGKWAEKHGYNFSVLAWRKPLSIINKNRFSQNIEFICRIYEHGTSLNKLKDNTLYDRVLTDSPIIFDKVHPTQKPVSILKKLIELNSKENDLILDPFMGSGSTGVACQNTHRKFIGIEKDKKYFKIAYDRMKNNKGTF